MGPLKNQPAAVLLTRLGALILVVAALYLARGVLIPLALAGLVSFIFVPFVACFERLGMPRMLSVILVTVSGFLLVAAVGAVITTQVVEMTESLPEYRDNIKKRI